MRMVYGQNHKNWTKQKYYRDHFVTKTFTVVRVELDSDSLSQFFTSKVFRQISVIDNIGGCLASMSVTENHVVLFFYQSSFPTNISHWLNWLIPSINVTVTENRFNFVCRWSRMEQCCLQTGRKWEQRRWKEVLQMAWSWRNGNINIFSESMLCLHCVLGLYFWLHNWPTIDIIQLLCFCWIFISCVYIACSVLSFLVNTMHILV